MASGGGGTTYGNEERITMSIALVFWILILLGLVLGGITNKTTLGTYISNNLIIWVLFALLGWAVFGAAVHK